MNIIEFINSKAIRKHLAKFGDIFSPLDKAYLIYQARQKSVTERISAMNELLESTEDFELKNARERFYHTNMTFHELLKGYIEIEQYLLDKFFEKEENAVYTYTISWKGHSLVPYNEPFSDYQSCFDALSEELTDDKENAERVEIIKRCIKNSHSEPKKTISAEFSSDLSFIHSVSAEGILDSKQEEICDIFDEMWVDVPTPFKKGDILYGPCPFVMGYGDCEPFVLLDVCNNDKSRTKLKESGDSSDMTAHGYWQRDNGQIYWECMHDYLSLEYYDGDFKGEKRILKALSSFLKGEITEVMLMTVCRIVLGEKELKDLKYNMNFMEETLNQAGF